MKPIASALTGLVLGLATAGIYGCGSNPISGFVEVGDPSLTPVDCPDFSGTYRYPGRALHDEVCTDLDPRQPTDHLHFPSDYGYAMTSSESTIVVEQDRCRALRLAFSRDELEEAVSTESLRQWLAGSTRRFEILKPVDGSGAALVRYWTDLEINLSPGRKHASVLWDGDVLRLRYRFTSKGFGAGWSRHYFTVWFEKEPDGALRYRLRHDETLASQPPYDGVGNELDLACVLPASEAAGTPTRR